MCKNMKCDSFVDLNRDISLTVTVIKLKIMFRLTVKHCHILTYTKNKVTVGIVW